jgi:glycosyltransferase involved in cell wall biosynthesis
LPMRKADDGAAWRAQWPTVEIIPRPLLALPDNLAKLWWEQVTVPLAAWQLAADVLWVPYWAAPWWQPVPVVVTIHDLIPALLPAYRGGWLQRGYTALVSQTARRSAAILTVSQASARDLVQQLRIPSKRVHVVYHGPNQENESRLDAQQLDVVRQKYRLPERFFLYLGGFDVRKNVKTTLHAYQRYLARGGDPAIKLVIAGQLPVVDSAFTPDPQKIAAEAGLLNQVHFCGWIDDRDKPALYALSTGYIFPSLYEGFGMMVLEAMQAGTPVVTSGEWGVGSAES